MILIFFINMLLPSRIVTFFILVLELLNAVFLVFLFYFLSVLFSIILFKLF